MKKKFYIGSVDTTYFVANVHFLLIFMCGSLVITQNAYVVSQLFLLSRAFATFFRKFAPKLCVVVDMIQIKGMYDRLHRAPESEKT